MRFRKKTDNGRGRETANAPDVIEMLRKTIDGASDLIAVEDTRTRYVAFNPAYAAEFKKIFGVDIAVGDSMTEKLAHLPNEQKSALELFNRSLREDFTITHEFGDERLSRRIYEFHCFPVLDPAGQVIGATHIARDVTVLRAAEDGLRIHQENNRRIIESCPDCLKLLDRDGRVLSINPGGQQLMELDTPSDYVGQLWIDFWQGEDRLKATAALERARSGGVGYFTAEGFTVKGTPKLWQEAVIPLLDESGRTGRILVIAHDITDIVTTQRELRAAADAADEGRRLLNALMEHVPEGIAIADMPDLKTRMLSRYGEEIFCGGEFKTAREIVEHCKLYHVDGTRLAFEDLPMVRAVRENQIIRNQEIIYVDENGVRKWHLVNAAPIYDAQGRITGGIAAWHEISDHRLTEEALKNERGFLRQVIDAAPSLIFVKDWDGRFVLGNQALAACYGTTPEEVVGKTDAAFNPNSDELEHFIRDDREVMSSRRDKFIPEEKVTYANGEVHWFSTIKVPLVNPDGSCDRVLGVATDITARKHAETAFKRFRFALDTAADNIFLIDPETLRFVDVSQSACRDLGYTREELLQLGPPDIMPQITREELTRTFSALMSNPDANGVIETMHYRRDCSGFQAEVTIRAVDDEGHKLVVAVARDITERKQAEQKLKRVNEQLAEADRRKDEFLAMLAHELRNPLAPIRNAAQVLRLAASQDPVLQRQRDIIDRQVNHMARLLDDLLDVSRITHGNINLKKQVVRLTDIFVRAVESSNPIIESRHHTLIVSPPPESVRVYGDFDRLIQIVGNLLSNSAKYTEDGGSIWLETGVSASEAVIRVRDTGMGIAPEMLPKIFDVFTQAERSLDRAQGGLGLGLTLVRNLAQMHGGRVEAHSEGLGKGSEFVVYLPTLSETDAASERESALPPTAARHHRILIVDDVVDTANSLAELLSLFGHAVRTAFDGASVLRIAHEFQPDVILLDIGLPGENGYDVARRIRSDAELKNVTLIALTGYGQEEDRRKAREAGFDHLFTKPVEFSALQEVLV